MKSIIRISAAACIGLALLSNARALDVPSESNEALLASASSAFAAGARAAAENPANASSALAPAVNAYRRLIDERGLHSAGLHYNLGNALYLSNDIGRAVLAYRRAQHLDAALPGLGSNLAAARAKVGFKGATGSGGSGEMGAASAVAWHTLIPRPARLWLAAGSVGAFWFVLMLRLIRRPDQSMRPPLWLGAACAAIGCLAAGSLWWQQRTEQLTPPGVIVSDRVVGRKGPDELGYEPSFTEPLRAGFEVSVLERRGSWVSVRLSDGRTTWVPAESVEAL
ncbi:MAG: hypothetical protein ACKVZJ_07995 [Phycisphaerales bacterium]